MKTIWNAADRRQLHDRVNALRPDAIRRWGTMSTVQMTAHLSDSLRMALGDLVCAPKKRPLRFPPLKQLIVYWLPWPEGAPTAPELISRMPASLSSEVAELTSLLERLARQPADTALPAHPAFGRLSRRAWGVLVYRHMDHHLTQFGV
jgi:hypothetical protein